MDGAIHGVPALGTVPVHVAATSEREAGRKRGDGGAFRRALAERGGDGSDRGASGKPAAPAAPVPVRPMARGLQAGAPGGRKDEGDGRRHVDVWA